MIPYFKNIKYVLIIGLYSLPHLIFIPIRSTYAQDTVGDNPPKLDNPINVGSIPELLAKLLDIMVMIGVPIAVLFIIFAGLKFVTARGNEEKLKDAKKMLLYTVIGTAILVGAALIANVIQGTINQLGG